MATLIEAIIFDGDAYTAAAPPGMRTVPVPADLTMLPVTDDVLSQLDLSSVGDERVPSGCLLQQPVAALARALSADPGGPVHRQRDLRQARNQGSDCLASRAGSSTGLLEPVRSKADLEPGYHLAQLVETASTCLLRR